MKGERLDDLFKSSLELGSAFNAVVETDSEAVWLFTYCGPPLERDRLATALHALGPATAFEARPGAHTHEIEDASRRAGLVLYVGTGYGYATLAACLVGAHDRIRAHASAADAATGHVAQAVHARRINLGGRPDRPNRDDP